MEQTEDPQVEIMKATNREEAEELKNKKVEVAEQVIDSSSENSFPLRRRRGFKQKVVFKVPMNKKFRIKALKIAVDVSGVDSAVIRGEDKNQLEVIGDGIDVAFLTTLLQKKIRFVELLSVSPDLEREKDEKQDDKKDHKIEEGATVQSQVSSSVANRIHVTDESSVDALPTQQEDTVIQIDMATKANTYSDLGLGNGESYSTNETTEWTLLIVSLLLEGASAIFDQLSYMLTSMVMAFVALLLSIVEFIRKARKERIIFDGGSLIPCFQRRSPHNFSEAKPFGGFVEYFGLLIAVWQCFYSTMQFKYTRQNLNNPIKMCLLPFIFVLCLFLTKLIKSVPRSSLVGP